MDLISTLPSGLESAPYFTAFVHSSLSAIAARTLRGRENLVAWLKHLENRSRHTMDRNDPMATYEFTWMWRELNVEHLRS